MSSHARETRLTREDRRQSLATQPNGYLRLPLDCADLWSELRFPMADWLAQLGGHLKGDLVTLRTRHLCPVHAIGQADLDHRVRVADCVYHENLDVHAARPPLFEHRSHGLLGPAARKAAQDRQGPRS